MYKGEGHPFLPNSLAFSVEAWIAEMNAARTP